jgi:gliding motility-associated-like protein
VTVRPLPSAGFTGNLSICSGQAITLYGIAEPGSAPITQWFWRLPGTIDSSGPSLQRIFPTPGLYPVSIQVRDIHGCLSQQTIDRIQILGTKAFAGNDTLVAGGVPFQLNGTGGVTYQWAPPTGLSNPSIPNPTATITSDITYILTASTPIGCQSTDTIRIRVFKGPEIYVPTAFSPNHDGLNDILRAIPVGVRFLYLRVYDRWGNTVFSTIDHRKGWDGTLLGRETPPGTYTWTTEGELPDGRRLSRKGTLQLIR